MLRVLLLLLFFVKGKKIKTNCTAPWLAQLVVQFYGCISWLLPKAKPRPLVKDKSSPSHRPNQTDITVPSCNCHFIFLLVTMMCDLGRRRALA